MPHLSDEILENTFMNGLKPIIKAEVLCFLPVDLEDMMEKAQLVEDKEITREEEEKPKLGAIRAQTSVKTGSGQKKDGPKTVEAHTTQTITLASNPNLNTKKEGGMRRLSDTEFQARKEKGQCFKCEEKYTRLGIDVRPKNSEQW